MNRSIYHTVSNDLQLWLSTETRHIGGQVENEGTASMYARQPRLHFYRVEMPSLSDWSHKWRWQYWIKYGITQIVAIHVDETSVRLTSPVLVFDPLIYNSGTWPTWWKSYSVRYVRHESATPIQQRIRQGFNLIRPAKHNHYCYLYMREPTHQHWT